MVEEVATGSGDDTTLGGEDSANVGEETADDGCWENGDEEGSVAGWDEEISAALVFESIKPLVMSINSASSVFCDATPNFWSILTSILPGTIHNELKTVV